MDGVSKTAATANVLDAFTLITAGRCPSLRLQPRERCSLGRYHEERFRLDFLSSLLIIALEILDADLE